ncbi:MAG: hypothetical protein HY796_08080 [Elusimicrobia bacterium]|nr:hypothetical protein [Elusimicrobiota bacterium]
MKVLIVNVNLAVDKTVGVGRLEAGRIYRVKDALTLPGGKGVNVARALKTLGLKAVIAGFTGGHNGRWLEEKISEEGFTGLLTRHAAGESRVCYSVVDALGCSTDFNEEGPAVPREAQARFLKKLAAAAGGFAAAAVCGRASKGLKKTFYSRLTHAFKKAGCFVTFDTGGGALKEGLAAGADVVKINKSEFEEISGTGFSGKNAVQFFEKYSPRGLKALMVTDGPHASAAVSQFGRWEIRPPRLKALKSPVGAGDSFMAGVIYGFMNGLAFEAALKLAAGCAASDCLSLGAGIISRKEALAFSDLVKIKCCPTTFYPTRHGVFLRPVPVWREKFLSPSNSLFPQGYPDLKKAKG